MAESALLEALHRWGKVMDPDDIPVWEAAVRELEYAPLLGVTAEHLVILDRHEIGLAIDAVAMLTARVPGAPPRPNEYTPLLRKLQDAYRKEPLE